MSATKPHETNNPPKMQALSQSQRVVKFGRRAFSLLLEERKPCNRFGIYRAGERLSDRGSAGCR